MNLLQSAVPTTPRGLRLRKRVRRLRPVKPSYRTELWYKVELLGIVALLRKETEALVLPHLEALEPAYAKDAAPVDIAAQMQALRAKFGGIEGVAARLAGLLTSKSQKDVDLRLTRSVKESLGVDISAFLSGRGPIQTIVRAAQAANVSLITSIPGQYFEKLEKAVTKGVSSGLRFEALAKEIKRIGEVTESRAKLIARDQTAKLSGAINQVRQMSVGIEGYTWSTSQDERVRPSHKALDGKTFSWDKPPAVGHPGEDVQCRCVAIPSLDLDSIGYGDQSGIEEAATRLQGNFESYTESES